MLALLIACPALRVAPLAHGDQRRVARAVDRLDVGSRIEDQPRALEAGGSSEVGRPLGECTARTHQHRRAARAGRALRLGASDRFSSGSLTLSLSRVSHTHSLYRSLPPAGAATLSEPRQLAKLERKEATHANALAHLGATRPTTVEEIRMSVRSKIYTLPHGTLDRRYMRMT